MNFKSSQLWWIAACLGVGAVGVGVGLRLKSDASDHPASTVAAPVVSLGNGFSSPLLNSTAATELTRLIAPWEPHRVMVVAVPRGTADNDPGVYQSILSLVRVATEYIDVAIMIPHRWPEIEARILRHFVNEPKVRARLHFVPSPISSVWTRDYLPQYGLSKKNGRLVLLDSRSVDLTSDPVEMIGLLSDLGGAKATPAAEKLRTILGDDISPSYLGTFLRTEFKQEIRLVRPPLSMDGGDFVQLGVDEAAVSESTLRYNGGQDEELGEIFRKYYGVKKVHYLPTLPGRTIDHLDFIVQGLADNVIIAARPPDLPATPQIYAAELGGRIRSILTGNLAYLRRHFGKMRVIEVPMPPPIFASRKKIVGEIRRRTLQRFAANHQIDISSWWTSGAASPAGVAASTELKRRLVAEFGEVNLENEADLDRVARKVLGEGLNELEMIYLDQFVGYRTYINSTLINIPGQGKVVLIPRYRPRNELEAASFPALEAQTLDAYRTAIPGAKLVWVDCDHLIDELGAVHCVTHMVPKL